MELGIRENHDFVVPVIILTLFAHACFLGPHYTLVCVLIETTLIKRTYFF